MIRNNLVSLATGAALLGLGAQAAKTEFDYSHGQTQQHFDDAVEQRQTNNDHIYVHLITHTHDDVGWLKTADEYYSGASQDITVAEVHLILSTVVDELLADPSKVFTYVEMKFFSMWWDEQTEDRKADVRMLVKEHRLEFMNAGWSMHDEACTHADDMMNNMMVGHEFLKREFDYVPKIGWHIDPFGHSNANARLFAEMGFDAWFYARIDWNEREQRMEDKSMQWIWRPFWNNLGSSVEIFTGVLQDMYWWPDGFSYDEREYYANPVIGDPTLETFNADKKSQHLYNHVSDMTTHYRGNHMFIPWGADFAYGNAHLNFASSDALIEYFNSHYDDMTLMYSTPYMYLDALKAQDIEWPVKYTDTFPYADDPEDYWSGYFTSRPNSKSQIRGAQANLHASNKLFARKVLNQATSQEQVEALLDAKHGMFDALGINQHHDAVTGTSKQAVANDYLKIISKAQGASDELYGEEMAAITNKQTGLNVDSYERCTVMNGTYTDCPIASFEDDKKDFLVSVHNPATVTQHFPRIKVPMDNYDAYVFNSTSSEFDFIDSDLFCYDHLNNDRSSDITCDLFLDHSIRANGFGFYKIVKGVDPENRKTVEHEDITDENNFVQHEHMKLIYTETVEGVGSIFELRHDNHVHKFALNMKYYNPATDSSDSYNDLRTYHHSTNNCASGAYIFKPAEGFQYSMPYSHFDSVRIMEGKNVHVFQLFYNDISTKQTWTGHLRMFRHSDVLEYEVQMLEIPIKDGYGKEVIATFSALDFNNTEKFYTDSNTLEMQYRKKNWRPDNFELLTHQEIAANYYPIGSAIAIRDQNTSYQMTVMNDRAQGGSSILNGEIELMQNRRLLFDDQRGVDEALNEKKGRHGLAVSATYRIQIFHQDTQRSAQRQIQQIVDEPLQYFFDMNQDFKTESNSTSVDESFADHFHNHTHNGAHLKVHMFPEHKNQILVRIENIADVFDKFNGTEDQTVFFDLRSYAHNLWRHANHDNEQAILNDIRIDERTLGNSDDYRRMHHEKHQWKTETVTPPEPFYPSDRPQNVVALQPQRIRLFRIQFDPLVAYDFQQ